MSLVIFTHGEENRFCALTKTLHGPTQTRRAPSRSKREQPWPRQNKFSLTCRRPPGERFFIPASTLCIGRVFTGLYSMPKKTYPFFKENNSKNSTKQWARLSSRKLSSFFLKKQWIIEKFLLGDASGGDFKSATLIRVHIPGPAKALSRSLLH